MKKNDLVEKAKSRGKQKTSKIWRFTPEHKELALAWVADEVSLSEVGYAMGYKTVQKVYPFLADVMKQIMKEYTK